jgi:kinesin family protein 6/9
MMGNFIRQVSSTPLNQTSTRSHCIFTINLDGHYVKKGMGFMSKLHLVDLAGSERVYKT